MDGLASATVPPRGGAAKEKSAQGLLRRSARTAAASDVSASSVSDAVCREMRASPAEFFPPTSESWNSSRIEAARLSVTRRGTYDTSCADASAGTQGGAADLAQSAVQSISAKYGWRLISSPPRPSAYASASDASSDVFKGASSASDAAATPTVDPSGGGDGAAALARAKIRGKRRRSGFVGAAASAWTPPAIFESSSPGPARRTPRRRSGRFSSSPDKNSMSSFEKSSGNGGGRGKIA
mmetsp:Transcript_1333/g.3987  ORF Transcript_1333/g.3987 Transcript_1333/m.3987 type:complete len:239 (-) Transcript_1333:5-721(-)